MKQRHGGSEEAAGMLGQLGAAQGSEEAAQDGEGSHTTLVKAAWLWFFSGTYMQTHNIEYYQEEGEFHTRWRAVTSLRLWSHSGKSCSWSVAIDGHRLSIIFEKSGVSHKFPMSRKRQMSHPSSRRARRGIWGITSQQASHQVWENYWTNHPQSHFLSTLRLAGISIIDLTQANHARLTQLLSQRTWSAPLIRDSIGFCSLGLQQSPWHSLIASLWLNWWDMDGWILPGSLGSKGQNQWYKVQLAVSHYSYPQPTILRPMLFSIFTNSLDDQMQCIFSTFADNTKLGAWICQQRERQVCYSNEYPKAGKMGWQKHQTLSKVNAKTCT